MSARPTYSTSYPATLPCGWCAATTTGPMWPRGAHRTPWNWILPGCRWRWSTTAVPPRAGAHGCAASSPARNWSCSVTRIYPWTRRTLASASSIPDPRPTAAASRAAPSACCTSMTACWSRHRSSPSIPDPSAWAQADQAVWADRQPGGGGDTRLVSPPPCGSELRHGGDEPAADGSDSGEAVETWCGGQGHVARRAVARSVTVGLGSGIVDRPGTDDEPG